MALVRDSAGKPRRILAVDDEPTLIAALQYNLQRAGYEVLTADRGDTGLDLAMEARPELVILDVMLPGLDGLEVCRLLRRHSSVPILMLTARAEEVDRVVGLELGADDYLTKPFSMRELLARVRALLRRAEMPATKGDGTPDRLQIAGLVIDFARHAVSREGLPVTLKPKELQLLMFLARNPGRTFTREQLLDRVWGYEFAVSARTVDVHVRWLREKIEQDPSAPRHIVTVRGTGYRFEA